MRVWIVQRYGQVAAARESRRSAMEEVPVFTSTPQTVRLQDLTPLFPKRGLGVGAQEPLSG